MTIVKWEYDLLEIGKSLGEEWLSASNGIQAMEKYFTPLHPSFVKEFKDEFDPISNCRTLQVLGEDKGFRYWLIIYHNDSRQLFLESWKTKK